MFRLLLCSRVIVVCCMTEHNGYCAQESGCVEVCLEESQCVGLH